MGDIGGAIAKRSVVIAVWDVGNAIAVLGEWGVRSLFGYVGSAIAGWECLDAIAFGMCGMRSLFWDVGCDRFWGCWECDSEALRRNRCLGFWECDRFLGILGCDRYWGIWGCDRCFRGVGMRSLLGDVGSAIAVLGCGVRSLLGMLGVR